MTNQRWGVLGGVFDPIHYGHLTIAEQVADALDLERVLFVPAASPVHKDTPIAEAQQRAAMAELAVADNPRFEVSRMEIERLAAPLYSVDTLGRLADENPATELVFIVSVEAAVHLPEWHQPERLLDLALLAVVPRLGYANLSREWINARFPGRAERFCFVETSHLGHSSSDIRARLRAGRSIRYLVPPAVERHIGEHHLYGVDDRPEA